jgi:general secretion pathway protein F
MLPASLSPAVPRQRATVLAQWSRLLSAGLPAGQVAGLLEQQPKRAAAFARAVASALRAGTPVGQAVRGVEGVPSHYPALLDAGESSGTLPDLLTRLAEDCEHESEWRKRLLRSLAYPAIVFVLAGLILPVPSLVLGDLGKALATAVPLIGLPGAGLLLLTKGMEASARGSGWPTRIPGVAALIDLAARARWCRVTARLLGAGVALPATLKTAAEVAGRGPIGEAARCVHQDVNRGRLLGESLVARGLLTPESAPLAGEADAAGTGDSAFLRAATLIETELDERLGMRTRILGATAYALAVLVVAWKIISFWTAHFSQLS